VKPTRAKATVNSDRALRDFMAVCEANLPEMNLDGLEAARKNLLGDLQEVQEGVPVSATREELEVRYLRALMIRDAAVWADVMDARDTITSRGEVERERAERRHITPVESPNIFEDAVSLGSLT